jgi:hypothetical protein
MTSRSCNIGSPPVISTSPPAGTQPRDFAEHFLQRHLASAIKAELAVAPGAAQVASGQSHEDAGQAGVRRFTLQRFVDFGYLH